MAKIRLRFACDEPWSAMRPVPGGRHCERCDKRVVDFRRMTEREAAFVVSLFPPGAVCGRLPNVRGDAPSFRAPPSARRRTPALLMTAALATACSAPTAAVTADPVAQTAKPATLDSDGDGILDAKDQCPNEPEDRDGFEDGDGCPDPDNDRDRIPDAVDKCPNEPETYNGYEDEDGCPDRGGIVVLEPTAITVLHVITFDASSDAIRKAMEATLDEVATTFKGHPELGTFVVKGHSLTTEKDAAKLAERRANKVVAALIKRGVDAASLEARALPPESTPTDPRVDFEVAVKASCPKP